MRDNPIPSSKLNASNMAENPAPHPIRSAKRRQRRRIKFWLIAGASLVVLTVAGFFAFQNYRRVRQRWILERAQAFLDRKDGAQAVLSLRQALQRNPRDVAANRMMAEIAEKAGSAQAIFWRRNVAELEPSLANRLAWADACIFFGEPAVGEQALANATEADKKSAAYHHMTGQIAEALKQADKAGTSFAEAVRLEPANEQYQFALAAHHLLEGDTGARTTLERLSANPKLARSARRILCQDAVKRNDPATALQFARQLESSPDAPYEDRLLHLSLLRQFRASEFNAFLLDLQEQSLGNPNHLAALIAWLNRNSLALLAVDWSKRLPEEIRTQLPIPAAVAESFANLGDWSAVTEMVSDGNWKELDFMRLALFARALRQDGDLSGSWNQWTSAVKAADNAPERLAKLAHFAIASKWQKETTDLLWAVAKGKTNQQWALAALWRENLAAHDTHALLNTASRMLELDPKNPATQHNVATLSFLLNSTVDSPNKSDVERAQTLASEAYKTSGNHPGFAGTYAYSLNSQGKTEEALALIHSLPDQFREDPASAIYYSVILADAGEEEEAAKYLELAQHGSLLPEERNLLEKTKKKLAHRGSALDQPR